MFANMHHFFNDFENILMTMNQEIENEFKDARNSFESFEQRIKHFGQLQTIQKEPPAKDEKKTSITEDKNKENNSNKLNVQSKPSRSSPTKPTSAENLEPFEKKMKLNTEEIKVIQNGPPTKDEKKTSTEDNNKENKGNKLNVQNKPSRSSPTEQASAEKGTLAAKETNTGPISNIFDDFLMDRVSLFEDINTFQERIKQRFAHLKNIFENIQNMPISEDVSYKMKMMIDEGGHVHMKEAQKEPGREWNIHEEEYDRENKGLTSGSEKGQLKGTEPKAVGQH